MSVAVIILAAGSSSRLGQSKQLLTIHNETLLRKICKAAITSHANRTIVVLGTDEAKHRTVIDDLDLTIVVNHEWTKGMGSSLKKGLQFLLAKNSKTKAIIISVCDQPMLNCEIFNQLIDLYKKHPKKIIASSYNHTLGVPTLFGSKWYKELLNTEDQAGAKKVILKNKMEVVQLPFELGALDIDTPEDLKRLNDLLSRQQK